MNLIDYDSHSRLPRIVQAVAPVDALKVDERAWNAYPKCKTIITNPFLGERFEIVIQSMHLPDSGETDNVSHRRVAPAEVPQALELSREQLKNRTVQLMDIGNDPLDDPNTKNFDLFEPSKFKSVKTGRGPLVDDWIVRIAACCIELGVEKQRSHHVCLQTGHHKVPDFWSPGQNRKLY